MGDDDRISVDTDTSPNNPIDSAIDSDAGLAGITALPGVNHATDMTSTVWDMVEGDAGIAEGIADLGLTATHFAAQVGSFISDPIGTLAAWGLDVLLALVQPLQDALDWVTGSPSEMESTAEVWNRIAQANVDLSQAVADTMQPLSNWVGNDGAAARLKTDIIAAGFYGVATEANYVSFLLGVAQVVAEGIQSIIKYLISQLVKYFITEIAPMILASPATFGASAATGVAWASVRAGQTAVNVSSKIAEATGIFSKIVGICAKIGGSDAVVVAIDALRNGIPDAISMGSDASGEQGSIEAGPGDSLNVDAAEIASAAPILTQIGEDASGVSETVGSTATDDLTWGITGLFFASDYNERAEQAASLIGASTGTLETLAGNIEGASNDWQDADDALSEMFKDIDLVIVTEDPACAPD